MIFKVKFLLDLPNNANYALLPPDQNKCIKHNWRCIIQTSPPSTFQVPTKHCTTWSKQKCIQAQPSYPPESIVPLIAVANDANATPQIFVAYVAPAAPAKSFGYPPPIAEAWPSLPHKIAASTIFLLRRLIGAELRHGAKRSSEA